MVIYEACSQKCVLGLLLEVYICHGNVCLRVYYSHQNLPRTSFSFAVYYLLGSQIFDCVCDLDPLFV